jgi:hypothetical protein
MRPRPDHIYLGKSVCELLENSRSTVCIELPKRVNVVETNS